VAYAAQSDLEKYFGEADVLRAADRDGDGVADTDVITTAITAAEEEIDSYVAVRYDLPLAVVPGVLTRVCSDLAMYHMSIDTLSMTEDKEKRYERGLKWLRDLSRGVVTLGVEEEQVEVQDNMALGASNPPRLFTRTKLGGLF
jgi:phage gp36-like protein